MDRPLDKYNTTEEKALFVSGMGLHTGQDQFAHVTEKHNNQYSDDKERIYSEAKGWEWIEKQNQDKRNVGKKEFQGAQRYIDTIDYTVEWVNGLITLYGDDWFKVY